MPEFIFQKGVPCIVNLQRYDEYTTSKSELWLRLIISQLKPQFIAGMDLFSITFPLFHCGNEMKTREENFNDNCQICLFLTHAPCTWSLKALISLLMRNRTTHAIPENVNEYICTYFQEIVSNILAYSLLKKKKKYFLFLSPVLQFTYDFSIRLCNRVGTLLADDINLIYIKHALSDSVHVFST